jgi:hypothetical protein
MRRLLSVFLRTSIAILLPAVVFAQSDLCVRSSEPVPTEARAEQLRIEAAERAARETERRGWDVKMFSVKNSLSNASLQALCIFRIEVVNQSTLRVVQVRAPKELMLSVEDAIKRLDVPPPSQIVKSIDLTGYLLVAVEPPDPKFQPLPAILKSVGTQLANILPSSSTLVLADTFVLRGLDRQSLSMSGFISFSTTASIRDGSGVSVVHLDRLNMIYVIDGASGNQIRLDTNVDVPPNTQVVVGKATPNRPGPIKAVVLVMTAKILD